MKLKSRGMNIRGGVAIGDGAMGFWAALEANLSFRVSPTTLLDAQSHERIETVYRSRPRRSAKQALHSIWQAETLADAEKAFDLFIETYEPKSSEATLCLTERP